MDENLAVHTFGGLRFVKAGQTVTDTGSRKVEALFLYLALADRPQPREVLADLLWDDRSQQQAMANLRYVLTGLRKHFGPYLEITRTTAALVRGSELWLDARELQNRIAPLKDGREALSPELAARVEEGIDLYQGDFLAGFHIREASGFEAWLTEEREYWRNLVLEAAATLAVSYEEAGMFPEGIALSRRALQIDPLQEAAHRQLMRLFTLSGRRTDAITQYENCRQILWDELGVTPSPETENLFDEITGGAFAAQAEGTPSTPVIQIKEAGSIDSREERDIPHNLPPQMTPLIGREKELTTLEELLEIPENRLVTILGAGGMGKTRLALAAAEKQLTSRGDSLNHPYKNGVYFVPLASVDTPDKIPLALAEQLEILFYGSSDPADQILEYLASQRALLIFDSFEHLMAGVDFIATILQRAPNVTVLVTSRERLLIAGETLLRLGGLSFPADTETELTAPDQAATEYGAIGLFLHHARLVRPDLKLDPNTLAEVARICKLVQGMPLAIILSASWVEALPLDELGDAIASSMDILASEQRDLPPRQRSIRAAFEASWNRLTPAEQDVFTRISVFRGGFTLQAAEAVAGANLFTLRRLIEKSLVSPPSQIRYEQHELLRKFGEEKLAESGETEKAQEAHGKYYLGVLETLEADVKGRRQFEGFKEIDADLDNIQGAWDWALARDQFSPIDDGLETLTLFCYYNSRGNEGHRLLKAASEKLGEGKDEQLLGRVLARHAWLRAEYGLEADSIEADLDRSWEIAERFDDQREVAQVLLARGYYLIRIFEGRSVGLVEFERAFQISKALDDRFFMSLLLLRIGYCQADPMLYIDFTRQGLALALETGNVDTAATAQNNIGAVLLHMGDLISGEELFHKTLKLGTKYRYRYHTSSLLALAGFLKGDLDQMKKYLPPQEHMVIGKVIPLTIVYILGTRALLAAVNGDLDMAEELARRSLSFPSNYHVRLLAHWAMAMVCLDQGNLAEAGQQLSSAYKLPRNFTAPGVLTRSLPVAAVILAKSDRPERAAQVISLAQNHPASQIGWLRHWPSGAALRTELEHILGKIAFQKAWEQGKTLDLVETFEGLSAELLGEVEAPAPQHNLPIQTTPIIGREKELATLEELLAKPENRLMTIVGPGGMGKTRLSIEAAARQTRKFPDGIYFAPLAPVSTPDKIPLALAEQLEILLYGSKDPANQILDFLEDQRLLLVFDNFEHLMGGVDFIASILHRAPNVTILVTSRERLLIAGEALLWLGGLSYPEDADALPATPDQAAADFGAVSLFLHHARLVRPDLVFDTDKLAEVARICKLVQGMPLAIILAASWVEALSLDELGDAIASSMDILASEQRDLPPRQRSIRAAFEASWTRLSPEEQAVFTKLSVFRGGFTLQAAEVVAGANLFTLRRLIEKSLVTPPSQNRYELHELLRQFATEKLAESGETEGVQEAHGQYYLGALKTLEADVKGGRQGEAFKEINADLDNIQGAWSWALEESRYALIDAALETLIVFCYYTDRGNEGHGLFRSACEKLAGANDERLLGRLLARHTWLKAEYGLETDSIEAELDKSWAIAEGSNDQREMAQVLLARGFYLNRTKSDRAAGLGEFERALQICKRLDDQFYMSILLGRIGFCQVDPALNIDFYRQSLELALEIGNESEVAIAQNNLGGMSIMMGDIISGEQFLHQSLAIQERIALSSRYYFNDSTARVLALAGFLRGDLDQVKRYLPPQKHMVIGKTTPISIASSSAQRALLAAVNGDLDMAEELARRSLNFATQLNRVFLARWALAMVCLDRDNPAEAGQELSVPYRLPTINVYPGVMTMSLPVAALVLAKSGRLERASQVLSLAQNHPASQIGWLRHWPSGAALQEKLENSLGRAAFQKAWEQGKALDLAETIFQLAKELSGE